MPVLDLSELNIILGVLGGFILLYGIISTKIKAKWYLGEALPAVFVGVLLGPIAAKFIETEKWGSAEPGQTNEITLGLMRVMIGVQLVIAGYQLPAKYLVLRWKEMLLLLLPVMTIMWLCTTLCIMATVPKLTLLAALVIGSCVTCTDPILSQAIAKGPFADKYVARPLREIISSEAGANDGFGFPFLMLATFLIRHANVPGAGEHGAEVEVEGRAEQPHRLLARAGATIASQGLRLMGRKEEEVGRLGGGVGVAMQNWFIETWIYQILMSVAIGAIVGFGAQYALKYALRRKWVDSESYLLYPLAIGLWLLSICGLVGTDDLLACFVAGNALNWDGAFLAETEERHDEVNSVMDVLLNFGGFMYIGAIMPWSDFNSPDTTGLTWGRLVGLGFLVLLFRRIPAIFISYKLMPNVCKNWKEALFMGYFGPIGAGAVFYVEHTRHLFPELGEGDEEETNLVAVMAPVVYWLVLFSIIVHGLSIPGLNLAYQYFDVEPIQDDAVELRRKSVHDATPPNAMVGDEENFIAYNRFSRPVFNVADLPTVRSRRQSLATEHARSMSRSRRSFARSRSRDVGPDSVPFPVPMPEKSRDESFRTSGSDDEEAGNRGAPYKRGRTIQYAV
ncbi:Sodium/hydrogen exchanger family-domain-containing protein [Emericellopsis atlantica]|uniref:Sodium/hydrogen exchanger family-domain-containing protein n=1 Tax=Emericellopsis atlantica TaxID=2614577 RepID=A0A9P7ZHT2_9HYPO|nr:Sodium/hydrogen exchanger family-domain-containing protein [Emericellopsis atlantica]KAG9251733.1 Sodium/hydrogen exchanger family-domain-containing protein [Emericellopsis atlantica]